MLIMGTETIPFLMALLLLASRLDTPLLQAFAELCEGLFRRPNPSCKIVLIATAYMCMELLCAHPAAVDISRCGRQLQLHSLAFTFVLSMFCGSRLPDAEVPIAPFCCSAATHS